MLAAARKMAVSELLAEPEVSKHIREVFGEGAVISTGAAPHVFPYEAYVSIINYCLPLVRASGLYIPYALPRFGIPWN